MQNSKLVQLLSSLKKEELKSFHHFILSPYHNTNKQAVDLFECIKGYHPDFTQSGLKKERVFRKIHPKRKAYHEGRLNFIMSQLTQLIFDFFAFEEIKKDDFQLQKLKLEAYKNRKMSRDFFKEAKKINAIITKKDDSEKKHLEAYLLNKEITDHPEFDVYESNKKELQEMLQNLDSFFLWGKLRLSVKIHNRQQVLNEDHKIKLLPAVLSQFKTEINKSKVLQFRKKLITFYKSEERKKAIQKRLFLQKVHIYNQKLSFLLTQFIEQSQIGMLKDLVKDFVYMPQTMSFSESQSNLIFLLNIIAHKCRNGDTLLKYTLLDLYKIGLGFRLLFSDKKGSADENIRDVAFINIVSLGGKCKDFTWTKKFIESYKHYLNPLYKDDILLLSKAYLTYHAFISDKNKNEENLAAIIEYLRSISFKRPFMAYRARILLFRVHYEYSLKKEENQYFITDFSNAFDRQIKRDKSLTSNKKAAFLNFIRLTRQLMKLKLNKNKRASALPALKESILNEKYLFAKDWLIEKIGELESSP